MPMIKKIKSAVSVIIVVFVLIQTGSCGFILYPERKGLTQGRIDPGVAILDCILFIPFVIPGIVALAVDFVTGCIYLPNGHADINTLSEGQDGERLAQADGQIDIKALERLLSEKTGQAVHLDKDNIRILRVNDPDYIRDHFTQVTGPLTPTPDKG